MNSLIRITYFISFLLLSLPNFAQVSETIRTDRPGQSFGQYTVGNKMLQFQGGVGYNNLETGIFNFSTLYENLVIRYGIKEKIEISTALNYASTTNEYLGIGEDRNGINQMDIGFRIHLFERLSGFSGSIQTRARLYFLQSEELRQDDDIGYISSVSLGYPLGNSLFVANVGTSDENPFLYTFNYSIGIGDSFSTFVELYGSYEFEFNNFFNAGFAYLINKDLQLDISAGIDLENMIDFYFVEGGVSYRIFSLR